jgi:hypothetical protein
VVHLSGSTIGDAVRPIHADPTMSMVNLVENACTFDPSGSTVEVAVDLTS